MDEKGFLLGLIQRSVRVIVKASEKTATRYLVGGGVLKPEFFFATPEARSEHYQHPIPPAENLGVWTIVARTKDEWTFVHISFPLDNSVV